MYFELFPKTFPVIDAAVCPNCSKKPCSEFSSGYRHSVPVSYGDVPPNCPLLIPSYRKPSDYQIHLSQLSRTDVIRASVASGRTYNYQSLPQTSVMQLIEILCHAHMIRVLVTLYGSPAYTALVAWRSAKTASFNKAIADEKKAVEAELEKEKPKPAFVEASWVWLEDPKRPACDEREVTTGVIQEAVWCKVDTEGLMPGDRVTFNLYLKNRDGKEDLKITTEEGSVGKGRKDDAALAKWIIPEQIRGYKLQPKLDQVYFIARCVAHRLEIKSVNFKLSPKPSLIFRNPKWEIEKVGFEEETDISVELELSPEHAGNTKVTFELFAKTPNGPELVHQGEGHVDGGKARCRIPVYIPKYKDADGNSLQKVGYYFTAKHSESEPLDSSTTPKIIDEMAERLIESHILPDLNFAFDKSFLHPKHAAELKDMCVRIKAWREKNPQGKLAVFGHADAVGKEAYNKSLSERRAKSVFGFLMKDAGAWSDLDKEENWGLACIQDLLKQLGHDPGASDGQDGPKTQAAVKEFQTKKSLPVDGQAGAGTRKALYQAFIEDSNSLNLKAEDFDVIDGKSHTGCSEYNLLEKTEAECEANRRVTVLFLKSNKNFPINYPCKQGSIAACDTQIKKKPGERRCASYRCFFYDSLVKEEKKGGGDKPSVGKLKFSGVADSDEVKQYVNRKAGVAGQGVERLVEAGVEGAADGTKVFWKIRAGKENSKRNSPKVGVKLDEKGALIEFKDGNAEIETTIKGGKTSLVLACGLAGGDVFTVGVGMQKGNAEISFNVVTWRKLWYQLTHHKDIVPPSMDTAVKYLKEMFIEWDKEPSVTHKTMPNGKVYIGNHNASKFHALLKSDKTNQCAHIILCDKQYDGLAGGINITYKGTADFKTATSKIKVGDLDQNQAIPNPPVQDSAKLFLNGSWSNPKTGKNGTLVDDASKINDDTGLAVWLDEEKWRVDLPKNATPAADSIVKVSLEVTGASGPWGGDGGSAPHNLIVIDSNDTIHSMCVMHELGHIMNMTPLAGSYKAPPGLTLNHKYAYTGMGGSGSHCAFEIDKATSTKKKNEDGKCIMFHQLNYGCKLIYCPECAPFVKAQALITFQELKG